MDGIFLAAISVSMSFLTSEKSGVGDVFDCAFIDGANITMDAMISDE